jgi:hypothetical protein
MTITTKSKRFLVMGVMHRVSAAIFAVVRAPTRFSLLPILCILSSCTGEGLGADLNRYAGGPDAEANAIAARSALVGRLPIGSNINRYTQLFKDAGGHCINDSNASAGVYMCRYSHSIALLSKAEWIVEIKYNLSTEASEDIVVNYYVTSL